MPNLNPPRADIARLREILNERGQVATVDAEAFGVSDAYWRRLDDRERALYAIVRPLPSSRGGTDISLHNIESHLQGVEQDVRSVGGTFELEPDFQRGHVWTEAQRVAYIEALMRGQAPNTLLFNCPGWVGDPPPGDIPEHTFQCVDGLQRLTTVMAYARGDLAVFGGLRAADFEATPFCVKRLRMHLRIMQFSSRALLLDFYLRINAGGTVHSEDELRRVRALLRDALAPAATPPQSDQEPMDSTKDRGVDRPRG